MGVVVPLRRGADAELPDGAWVRRALDGDMRAKEVLYRRHVGLATGLAHRLLGGVDVDDLVQDAFVTAYERLDTLRDPQAFAKWLGTIVVNCARATIRKRQRRRRFFLPTEAVAVDRLVSNTASAEVRLELRALYGLLDALPTDVRIALVLRRVEGLSIAEIAAQMGRSIATVKRRIQDGDTLLNARLERGAR